MDVDVDQFVERLQQMAQTMVEHFTLVEIDTKKLQQHVPSSNGKSNMSDLGPHQSWRIQQVLVGLMARQQSLWHHEISLIVCKLELKLELAHDHVGGRKYPM